MSAAFTCCRLSVRWSQHRIREVLHVLAYVSLQKLISARMFTHNTPLNGGGIVGYKHKIKAGNSLCCEAAFSPNRPRRSGRASRRERRQEADSSSLFSRFTSLRSCRISSARLIAFSGVRSSTSRSPFFAACTHPYSVPYGTFSSSLARFTPISSASFTDCSL